ncbi:MAG: hypothetical protein HRT44_04285 [Bdellovibrionales bacterium]|nr:Na+/H+ antiporter NhaC family protein [Bdellovibrionales bacterium]NQZ18462.1 hypothetical protein [Bdellovibrionales bacterium]
MSTWIGFEVGLFKGVSEKFNLGMDGYAIFLDAIPFRFYCFFMLIFVFVNAAFGIDFGPMKKARSENVNTALEENPKGHITCALVPLGVLLTLVFSLLWYDGGGWGPDKSVFSLSSWRAVLTKSENGILILLISSMISYTTSVFFALAISRVKLVKLWESFVGGVKSSMLPIMILVLAWSLKAVCDDLNTGEFIVSVLGDRVNPFWMPMAIFIVSAITAFSTGTSWGTMAILIPTVAPLALALSPDQQYSGFVALCLASILDGAIMGDHCSPVSDTTIMSSISTDCDLLEHVKTQLPYTLFVGSIALLFGYLPMSLGWSYGLFFSLACLVIVGLYVVLKKWPQNRRAL